MDKHQAELDGLLIALADPTRRAVLNRLVAGPATVSDLADAFPMALPSFLKHVRTLEKNGLIRTSKTGRTRTCELNPDGLTPLENWLTAQRRIWEGRADRLARFVTSQEETS